MRTLTLFVVLLVASPALATLGDDLGSEQQTAGYGRMFAYVIAAVASIVVILTVVHVIKGMMAEASRGKKSVVQEDILDEEPKKKRPEMPLYLGEKVPDWKIANRLKATEAALRFLTRTDDMFELKYLVDVAGKAFRKVKAAVEDRSTKAITDRVTETCLEELRTEVKRLREKGERRVFDPLEVTDLQIIHIEAPAGKAKHTFTALVSAESRDYYADDRTGKRLRGDKKYYAYQEFWRFRRSGQKWLVERIQSSEAMDRVLEPKNVLAQADLDAFTKKADPEHLREFVGK